MKMDTISEDHLEIHKIAFEQGLKGLESQDSDLSAIRQRATAVVSVSGLAGTLFGSEALKVPSGKLLWLQLGAYEWLALTFLIISVFCTFQILRPRNGWKFHFSPSLIVDQFAKGEKATNLSTTYRVLSKFAEINHNNNSKLLNPLYIWLNISLIAVVLQIMLWMLAVR